MYFTRRAVAIMKASLEARKIVTVAGTTIADGVAVAKPGEHTFPIIQKYVDEIVTVTEEEISGLPRNRNRADDRNPRS
jgi:threonine dehydratase